MRKTVIQHALCLTLLIVISISAFYQSTGDVLPHAVNCSASLLFFLSFSKPEGLWHLKPLLVAVVSLFGYTLLTSIFPVRSIIAVLSIASNGLIFATLHSNLIDAAPTETKIARLDATDSKSVFLARTDILDIAIFTLLLATTIHAAVLIYQYIDYPIRVTGLLRDYSQAALVILLTFGLVYSRIRDNKFSTPLCFILFLGFFTTFSRTANFLLLVFLMALAITEFNKPSFRRFVELTITIVLAAVIVYTFPMLVSLEAVDRGGVSQLSTLNSRTDYWFAAWQAIVEKPLTGHGIDTFSFTGIKTLRPQSEISKVHNDFLQILHDMGAIWLTVLLISICFLIIRFAPTREFWNPLSVLRSLTKNSIDSVIAWILILLITAYMTINFMIFSSIFQLIVALIVFILVREYKNQQSK